MCMYKISLYIESVHYNKGYSILMFMEGHKRNQWTHNKPHIIVILKQ